MTRGAILAGAAALLLWQHFGYFYGHFGYDDLHLARLANDLFHGMVDWSDHYAYRLVPIALIGLSHAIFGVNDWASALPGLLATGVILYYFYRHFRRVAPWQLLLALGLYASLKWNVFYADKMMPDLFVSALVFAGWTLYVLVRTRRPTWRSRRRTTSLPFSAKGASTNNRGSSSVSSPARQRATCPDSKEDGRFTNHGVIGACTGLLLFLAFNAKGTIILAVPLFLYYTLADIRSPPHRRFRYGLAGTSAVLLAAYFLFWYCYVGDPLARFSAITANHYLNDCSYDQLPTSALVERLTSGFWQLITGNWLIVHLFVAVVSLVFFRPQTDALYRNTILIGFLSINFMTISLTSYNPVCLDSRHILLFSPIFSACSVRLLAAWLPERWTTRWWWFLFVGLVTAALLYPSVSFAQYARTLGYRRVVTNFRELVERLPADATVYGSEVLCNYGDYFNAYGRVRRDVRFRNLDVLPDCGGLSRKAPEFVVRNWYADWHAGSEWEVMDSLARSKALLLRSAAIEIEKFEVFRLGCDR